MYQIRFDCFGDLVAHPHTPGRLPKTIFFYTDLHNMHLVHAHGGIKESLQKKPHCTKIRNLHSVGVIHSVVNFSMLMVGVWMMPASLQWFSND